jgi:hypothetical protein
MLTAVGREHIYRNHSIKNACNRCFESFDDPKGLKDHQRAQTPCRLSENARADVITEEQEELLRVRARANTPEEERWEDMYRIVFPDEKTIPSPCTSHHPPAPSPSSNANGGKVYNTPVSAPVVKNTVAAADPTTPPSDNESSAPSFTSRQMDEYKALIRREIRRVVEPMLVAEVERVFATAEVKVVAKADEIVRGIECRLARTFQWQAQAEPTPEPDLGVAVPDFLGGMLGGSMHGVGGGNEGDELGQVIDSLEVDPRFAYLLPSGDFNWDQFSTAGGVAEGCGVDDGDCLGSAGGDSAYFTSTVGSERWVTTVGST